MEYKLAQDTYVAYKNLDMILIDEDVYWERGLDPAKEYVVYACFVEKEGEYAKISGGISSKEFKTMPENTLNGEFTVDANGKKVHFAKANKYLREYGWESIFYDQYDCKCSVSNPPIDLMEWSQTKAEQDATASSPFFTLSNDQWWYLFRERDRAEHLFAHATISFGDWEAKGLIIMPDNWQKPDGIPLTTDYDWGFRWDKSKNKYVKEGIDGYSKNLLTPNNWERLEFAGAVFLPAAGSNGTSKYISGCYWTSTSFGDDTHARSIKFGKDHLDLDGLYESISNQTNGFSIRNVRVLD